MIKKKWNIFMNYSHSIHNFPDLKLFSFACKSSKYLVLGCPQYLSDQGDPEAVWLVCMYPKVTVSVSVDLVVGNLFTSVILQPL